ncbi:MAG: hypothetical protein ACREN7_00145 [Candidatus Dormibacteria bacterium]
MRQVQLVLPSRAEAAWLGAATLAVGVLGASLRPQRDIFFDDDDASPEFVFAAEEATVDIYTSVSTWQRALMVDTRFRARRRPSARERAELPPDQLLLGLYTAPPATVTIFEENIEHSDMTIAQVIRHELSHRWGYDHKTFEMRQNCAVVRGGGPIRHGRGRRR